MRFDFLVGFMVETLAILIAAKLVRDLVMRWRGSNVNSLVTEKRSVGAATTQAGYLIGVLLGSLGAISARGEHTGFLALAAVVALSGLVAIVLQLVADIVSDKLIFRGVEDPKTGADDVNVALAVGKAAVSVATGLVLRGALSDPEGSLLGRVAWFGVAQALMVVAVMLYCRVTPYDDLGEIKRGNLAAGFPIAGVLLAVGLIVEAAIGGRHAVSFGSALLSIAKILGVGLVLVYLFRLITSFIMLPRVKLARAIVEEKSIAAGVQEGLSFLLAALIVTFFLA
jgi:uncharacterized membrane protein YjfL (UPF0719 family)